MAPPAPALAPRQENAVQIKQEKLDRARVKQELGDRASRTQKQELQQQLPPALHAPALPDAEMLRQILQNNAGFNMQVICFVKTSD